MIVSSQKVCNHMYISVYGNTLNVMIVSSQKVCDHMHISVFGNVDIYFPYSFFYHLQFSLKLLHMLFDL
jgi:hypothetical protein